MHDLSAGRPRALRTRALQCILVLLALGAGPAAAWRSSVFDGGDEPNTLHDDATVMWQSANAEPVDRIYFDAFVDVSTSPPVVGLHVDDLGPPSTLATSFHAYLGYWRDCNRDGFIGDALTGAATYTWSETHDATLCPPTGLYNDGTFVTEMLLIGRRGGTRGTGWPASTLCTEDVLCLHPDPMMVVDEEAKLWHDWGLPGRSAGSIAPVFPFPEGALSDTNGHFQVVDAVVYHRLSGCADGWADAGCSLWPARGTRWDRDGDGRAEADPNQCGDAPDEPLTVVAAFATGGGGCSPLPNAQDPVTATARDRWSGAAPYEDEGRAIVTPWDWGTEYKARCELRSDLGLGALDLDGGLYPTLDHIWRSAVVPRLSDPFGDAETPAGARGGPCTQDPHDAFLGGSSHLEDRSGPRPVKDGADTRFVYVAAAHFNPSETLGLVDIWLCAPTDVDRTAQPQRCSGAWYADAQWLHVPGLAEMEPRPFVAYPSTFYADVNFDMFDGDPDSYEGPVGLAAKSITALPTSGDDSHVYGREECSDGLSLTWACDPAQWVEASGVTHPGLVRRLPKVGDTYDLRDVECRDDHVANAGPLALEACTEA